MIEGVAKPHIYLLPQILCAISLSFKIPAKDLPRHHAICDQGWIQRPPAVPAGEALLVEHPVVGGHLLCLEDLAVAAGTAERVAGVGHDGCRVNHCSSQGILLIFKSHQVQILQNK